jgi:uncharacterized membrane protein
VEAVGDEPRLPRFDEVDELTDSVLEFLQAALVNVGMVDVDDQIIVVGARLIGHVLTVRPADSCRRLGGTSWFRFNVNVPRTP